MPIRGPTITVLEATPPPKVRHAEAPRWRVGASVTLITALSGGLWGLIYMAVRALLR